MHKYHMLSWGFRGARGARGGMATLATFTCGGGAVPAAINILENLGGPSGRTLQDAAVIQGGNNDCGSEHNQKED